MCDSNETLMNAMADGSGERSRYTFSTSVLSTDNITVVWHCHYHCGDGSDYNQHGYGRTPAEAFARLTEDADELQKTDPDILRAFGRTDLLEETR